MKPAINFKFLNNYDDLFQDWFEPLKCNVVFDPEQSGTTFMTGKFCSKEIRNLKCLKTIYTNLTLNYPSTRK